MDEESRKQERIRRKRAEMRRRRRRALMIRRAVFALAVLMVLAGFIALVTAGVRAVKKNREVKAAAEAAVIAAQGAEREEAVNDLIAEADRLASMYDYDAAAALLRSDDAYAETPALTAAVKAYEDRKAACVPLDVSTVPHVFFHSLINDSRGFDPAVNGDFVAMDNGCWMCSTSEFKAMLQQMYEAGYVLVRLRDLVVENVDGEGRVHYTPNTSLMLPPDKKGLVFSEDDLSYYHASDNQGIASRLVLDADGRVVCEYTDADGVMHTGSYDVVPILNDFIDEHPDFSYHNARGMIALTGYNGVFGYRTDSVYLTRDAERLDPDQIVFLEAHPDFDYDAEVAAARTIADALKAEGWEFASHTWGHRHADTASLEALKSDNEKWVDTVEPIVGKTDTIIFAHGSDIAGIEAYTADNEKYAYFNEAGYHFYCNVDGSTAVWQQIGDGYVRSGRVNLDGYRLYQTMTGNERSSEVMAYLGIHDVAEFFDNNRVTPVTIP